MIELFIEDKFVDLGTTEQIPLNLQAVDIFNPSERKGSFSRSFDIPRTDNNNEILENCFAFTNNGLFAYKRINAILKINGVEMPIGFVVIENDGITERTIRLTYYTGNSNFFQLINDTKLNACAFGVASHYWNDDTILASRTNQWYSYPMIDNNIDDVDDYFVTNAGNFWDADREYKYPEIVIYNSIAYICITTSINNQPSSSPAKWTNIGTMQRRIFASKMLPALYGNTYKYAIEKTTGYTMEGDIFSQDIWNKLIFPFSLGALKRKKEDAEDRINLDLSANIQAQIPIGLMTIPLTSYQSVYPYFPTATKDNLRDGLIPYVGKSGGGAIYVDTQHHLSFPDYTISHIKFKARLSTGVNNGKFDFLFGDETIPIGSGLSSAVISNSVSVTMRNSKTGQVYPFINSNGLFRINNLPLSYSPNPAINFDWILEAEFDFLTGLQKSIGLVCRSYIQAYWYETETEVRFKNHVEHKDIGNYVHCPALPWQNYIIYSGRAVYVSWNFDYYHFIGTSPSLNQDPFAVPELWEIVAPVVLGGPNYFPKVTEENSEEDFYLVKYGAYNQESHHLGGARRSGESWITGSDLVPDISIAEWIKNIANMFGCLLLVNEETKVVKWKTWKEIYDEIPNAYDWSDKLVNLKNASWSTRAGVSQSNLLSYDNDKEIELGFASSYLIVNDETLPKEQTLFKLMYSSTQTNKKFLGLDFPHIPIISADDKVGASTKQRVLLIDVLASDPLAGTNPIRMQLREGSTLTITTNIPFCYFNDSTKAIQLGWNTHLQEQYHRWLNYIYDNYKMLNAELILTPSDIALLDISRPVFIKYYASYFLIQKVQDWVQGRPNKITLLKLN